jgi:hypothetical protein
MPGLRTEVTEIATALGTLFPDLRSALAERPAELRNVSGAVWDRLVAACDAGPYESSFRTAFANGRAFARATDGLRDRRPNLVEWKGPQRSPGDDVIPADLRIDHVYLVSCKYLSRVLLNVGPSRLFERRLVGDDRTSANWFAVTAPIEFQNFYAEARTLCGIAALPATVSALSTAQQEELKSAFSSRTLPPALRAKWVTLCDAVAQESSQRWRDAMNSKRAQLRMLWRLLRIGGVSYFVLGTDKTDYLRLRVASAWDWNQAFELREFAVKQRTAGQPEILWTASVRDRLTRKETTVLGHVEVRWSHGRFLGSPEAKVYLDTPHAAVPGYYALA